MSTILDALRKLQRERAAQSPEKDLRGSITHESASSRARGRGRGSRRIAALLALLSVGGGGYVLYKSGQVQALLARFQSDDDIPTENEFAAVEREELARAAAAARAQAPPQAEQPPAAEQAAPTPHARPPRAARAKPPENPVAAENPEIAAERARLEAALANARAAQDARAKAELEAATQQAVPEPTPTEPETAAAAASASAPVPAAPPPTKRTVAKRKPPTAAKPAVPAAPVAAPVAAAVAASPTQPKPAPRAEAPAARPSPEVVAEPAPPATAFPEVRVDSIRWHPIAERRVASLRFERQNAPEAREGDIVAGVLVYRIDPGSVELRVGSAQRTVSPGP